MSEEHVESVGVSRDTNKTQLAKKTVGEKLNFLLRDSSYYGVLSVAAKMVTILSLPIVIRMLSKEEYGLVDLLTVTGSYFLLVSLFSMNQASARLMAKVDDDQSKREVVSLGLVVGLLTSCTLSAAFFFFRVEAFSFIGGEVDEKHLDAFTLMILALPFQVIKSFCQMLLKWNFKKVKFAAFSLGFLLTNVGLTLYLLVFVEASVSSIFLANLVATTMFSVVGVAFCMEFLTLNLRWAYFRQLIFFGAPLTMNGLINGAVPFFERVLVYSYFGGGGAGMYALGSRVGSLPSFLTSAFSTAWGPFVYSVYKSDEASTVINGALRHYTLFLSIIGVAIVSLSTPLVLFFGGSEYIESVKLVYPIVYGVLIYSTLEISGVGILLSMKTGYFVVESLVKLATIGISAYLLIDGMGYLGIAVAFLAGNVVATIVGSYFSQKIYKLDLSFRLPMLYMLASMALSALITLLPVQWYFSSSIGVVLSIMGVWVSYRSAIKSGLLRYFS